MQVAYADCIEDLPDTRCLDAYENVSHFSFGVSLFPFEGRKCNTMPPQKRCVSCIRAHVSNIGLSKCGMCVGFGWSRTFLLQILPHPLLRSLLHPKPVPSLKLLPLLTAGGCVQAIPSSSRLSLCPISSLRSPTITLNPQRRVLLASL